MKNAAILSFIIEDTPG